MDINDTSYIIGLIVALIIAAVVVFASAGNIAVDDSNNDVVDTCLNDIPIGPRINEITFDFEINQGDVAANIGEHDFKNAIYPNGVDIDPNSVFPGGTVTIA